MLFAMDSISSSYLILNDLLFGRVFMYIPQLCPIVSPYFYAPSITLKIIHVFHHHARFAKSVAQTFMVLNRMTCVLLPATYNTIWKCLTPVACFLVYTLPFAGLWNIIISRQYLIPFRGGFGINYIKAVPWAALSMFQAIFVLIALTSTVICTTVTLYKLILLPGRLRSIEKSLCLTSLSISITFLLVAVTQLLFAFCPSCVGEPLYLYQLLAFDLYSVGYEKKGRGLN
uniref:Serpentine receptor class gamma n=1 Tax=Caenorhabditis tropicalis TaxID=1561998 RepID=A0A1I7U3U8_9PELO